MLSPTIKQPSPRYSYSYNEFSPHGVIWSVVKNGIRSERFSIAFVPCPKYVKNYKICVEHRKANRKDGRTDKFRSSDFRLIGVIKGGSTSSLCGCCIHKISICHCTTSDIEYKNGLVRLTLWQFYHCIRSQNCRRIFSDRC